MSLFAGCAEDVPPPQPAPLAAPSGTEAAPPPVSEETDTVPMQAEPAPAETPAETANPAGDVRVQVVDKAGYDKALAAHQGNVVLVDFWATWCVPCRRSFPETVKLARQYGGQGLDVVSVSFDEVAEGQAPVEVRQFLESQGATFENLISAEDIAETGAQSFNIDGGALPHYKLYNRDGQLIRAFSSGDPDNLFTHEDIVAAVKEALGA